jgi:uncharacterized protein GlcG (DUF336 family)
MSGHYAKVPYVVAQILADAAEAEALKIGKPMAIAVVDSEGGLQLFTRMDGTLPVSSELAVSKAYTAAILRMTSAEVGELAQPGAALYGIESTHSGRIVLFGGGLPLYLNGEVAGAVGVSGGSVEEDVSVARPAAELLQEMECCAEKFKDALPGEAVGSLALGRVIDEVWKVLERVNPPVPASRIAALAGGICLALS